MRARIILNFLKKIQFQVLQLEPFACDDALPMRAMRAAECSHRIYSAASTAGKPTEFNSKICGAMQAYSRQRCTKP
jgi:hypothetical protein